MNLGVNGVEGELSTGVLETPHETKRLSSKRSRGKSGKEKSIIIAELREIIKRLRGEIKKRKATTRRVRDEKNRRLKKEVLEEKISDLRKYKNTRIFNEKRRTRRRELRLAKQQDRLKIIRELEKQLIEKDKLLEKEKCRSEKFKQTINRIRGSKRRKRIIKTPVRLSAEEKRIRDIANKGIDVASYNVYVNSFRLVNFAKANHITVDLLSIMLQIELEGSVYALSLKTGTRSILNRGVAQGLLAIQSVGATKHYFLTTHGMDKVLELKKYIKRRKDFI